MLKHNIINLLGKKFNFTSYLEISSTSTGYAYNKIDSSIFITKSAIYYLVDIKESRPDINIEANTYEYHHNRISNDKTKYDIVFVDPWHTYEQTMFDLKTALKFVSAKGIIVVHDCCPYSEDLVGPYKWGPWCGQTYEAFIDFRYKHRELESFCLWADYGLGILSLSPKFNIKQEFADYDKERVKRFEYFNKNKKELLNLVEADEFIKIIEEN